MVIQTKQGTQLKTVTNQGDIASERSLTDRPTAYVLVVMFLVTADDVKGTSILQGFTRVLWQQSMRIEPDVLKAST